QALGEGHRRDLGRPGGFQARDDHYGHYVQRDQQQAGGQGGGEELGEGLLRDERVDGQDHRGRDQDSQGAGRGDAARGEAFLVTVAAHLGDRDLGEGRRGGDGGAADRAEGGAGADGGVGKGAAEAGEDRVRRVEELARHAGARGDRAHQDEEGYNRQ